jgi:hypothetical protein
MNDQEKNPRKRRGSIFFPLLLIAIGVAFLLNNLGVIPGDFWGTLFQLWPVILIVIGLDSIYRREGLVGPTFLIGLGLIFLFANLGYLAVNVWQMVLALWPLLLIAIGLDILIGHRSRWLSLLGIIFMIVLLVGSIYLFRSYQGRLNLVGVNFYQDFSDAELAEIAVERSIGTILIQENQEVGDQLALTVGEGSSDNVAMEITESGGVAYSKIQDLGSNIYYPGSSGEEWTWLLHMPSTLPIDTGVDLGAGNMTLELEGLEIHALNTNMGLGQTNIELPEEGAFEANISGAMGQILVYVPKDLAVKVRLDTGLVVLQSPDDFSRHNDVYYSPGFSDEDDYIDLTIDLAIGNVAIQSVR